MHSQPPSSHDPPEKKRARKDEEADLPELQNKKILVSKAEVQEISMVYSLAKNNESDSIELSWAWEPTYRERA